jgi:serine protease Do
VVVSDVIEDSPGGRAGLREGDIIERMDAVHVDRAHKLRWQVSARGAGKSVLLQVRRHNRPMKLKVKLDELPSVEEAPVPAVAARPAPSSGRRKPGRLGKERPTGIQRTQVPTAPEVP